MYFKQLCCKVAAIIVATCNKLTHIHTVLFTMLTTFIQLNILTTIMTAEASLAATAGQTDTPNIYTRVAHQIVARRGKVWRCDFEIFAVKYFDMQRQCHRSPLDIDEWMDGCMRSRLLCTMHHATAASSQNVIFNANAAQICMYVCLFVALAWFCVARNSCNGVYVAKVVVCCGICSMHCCCNIHSICIHNIYILTYLLLLHVACWLATLHVIANNFHIVTYLWISCATYCMPLHPSLCHTAVLAIVRRLVMPPDVGCLW